MPLTTIRTAPSADSFTSLADHQSQTPTNFYGGKPVLHYQGIGHRAIAPRSQISKLPIFARGADRQAQSDVATDSGQDDQKIVEVVDAFISSENLTLFNPATSTGVSIPYPAISLHAIQRLDDPSNSSQEIQGLYMQLELSDLSAAANDDEEQEIVELTLVAQPSDTGSSAIQTLFEAVSNCSNLHPDPAFGDEDMEGGEDSRIIFEGSVGYDGISGLPGVQRGAADGGLPPPFPGSGGWITAENVSEYFDGDGNWIGGENGAGLGEGAGRVRARDEVDGEEGGVNGHGAPDSDENKRARTD
ncbi:Uncharacterized protein BP5553_03008 [Venustampulla echinocandica]|uniref:Benzoylformate decarboxylase n=1 Tax=Venustampulla echinocandica TaxID=2656787 RepID=A0A370TT43_9HELO|nr:Uncharacterized protein BP5553_03008 [Venustampulla echinocandica]RDL38668.1 Uncharacterized protein BP5553_03008 [Venustampulla echinocandica]